MVVLFCFQKCKGCCWWHPTCPDRSCPYSCCLRPFSTFLAISHLLSPAMLQSTLSHCSPQNIPLLVELLPHMTGTLHSLQNWVLPQYLLILLRT